MIYYLIITFPLFLSSSPFLLFFAICQTSTFRKTFPCRRHIKCSYLVKVSQPVHKTCLHIGWNQITHQRRQKNALVNLLANYPASPFSRIGVTPLSWKTHASKREGRKRMRERDRDREKIVRGRRIDDHPISCEFTMTNPA